MTLGILGALFLRSQLLEPTNAHLSKQQQLNLSNRQPLTQAPALSGRVAHCPPRSPSTSKHYDILDSLVTSDKLPCPLPELQAALGRLNTHMLLGSAP